MALGAKMMGPEATKWLNEKRVRKEWSEILAEKKAKKQLAERLAAASSASSTASSLSNGSHYSEEGPGHSSAPSDLVGWW
jgi:hypothetical protein